MKWSSLKVESVYGQRFHTRAQARGAALSLIVGWGGMVILLVLAIMDGEVVTIPFVIGKMLPVFLILASLHSIRRKVVPS